MSCNIHNLVIWVFFLLTMLCMESDVQSTLQSNNYMKQEHLYQVCKLVLIDVLACAFVLPHLELHRQAPV